MSGPSLALSSLAGADGTPRANQVVCALLCALSACPRRASLRFVRAGRLLFHGSPLALTLGCAHTLLCGRFLCSRGWWKSRLVVGVFACGWLGFVFTRGACSCGCLRALVLAQVCWGWWDSVVPPPLCPGLLACLRAHAFGVGLLACAQFCACPLRAGCNSMGRDMVVPPHTAWRALLRSPRGAGREKAGVLTLGVLTRAHAQREREREGRGRGATWGGPWWTGWGRGCVPFGACNPHPGSKGGRLPPARRGVLGWLPSGRCWSGRGLWVVARWVVTRIGGDKYPKPGESKN